VRDDARLRDSLRRSRGRISPDGWALVLIVAAVIVANLPYLLNFVDPNPLGPRGGLASAVAVGFTRGLPTIDPNNGFISQALSHRAMLDVVHLKLPWWNPFEGTGAPLAGEMQSAALFPPTLLTLLSNGQLYEHLLLELVAGISTYLLLRRIAVNRWACVAGAIAFALNGTFAWFTHAAVNPVAFLPLLLLGIELARTAAAEGRRGGWWLIALAGALSFYAGFPEVAYIDTVLTILWFAWRCAGLDRRRLRALVAKGAAGALAGTLLAAPLLIAAIDYVGHADLGVHATSLYGSAHIRPQGWPQLLLPYVYGPIFDFADPKFTLTAVWSSVGGYLSTSLLLLAGLGLISRGRRGLKIVLLAWIVLALSRMYGLPLLGHVLGVLPAMSRIVFFRYATASVELSVIVLAALGMDDLVNVPAHRRRAVWGSVAALALIAVAALGAHPLASQLGPRYHAHPFFAAAVLWGAGIVIVACAITMLGRSRIRAPLLALVVAVDAIVLFAAPELSAPRAVQVDTAPAAFLQRHLATGRFFTLGPVAPNYGSYFGVASLNINDVPIPSRFPGYVRAHLDPFVNASVFVGNLGGGRSPFVPSAEQELVRNLAGYRAAAVSYVLTPAGQSLPPGRSGLALVFRSPTTWIYRVAGAAPLFTASDPGCAVRALGTGSAQVSCPQATTLIRRETYMPGWSAAIDGHGASIRPADGLFQAINVSAGSHRVTFSFAPPNIGWGALAFVVGLAWLLGGTALAARRRIGRAGA
jgi:hypothetical protein